MRVSIVGSFLALLFASVVDAQTWDASTDFSATQNPNGAWTYGWTPTLGGAFTAFTQNGSCTNTVTWYEPSGSALSVGKNISNAPTSCATWTLPAQMVITHPGSADQKAVTRWTAPVAGTFQVGVAFLGIDYAYPTTTDVSVLVNGQTIFSGSVNAYGSGPSFGSSLSLNAGDTVDAAVGFGGNGYLGDATGLTFTITGGSCPASRSNYGAGWPGTLGVPALTASANPVFNSSITIDVANSLGANTSGILVLGLASTSLQSGYGGTLVVNPQIVAPIAIPSPSLSIPAVIPNLPALCGVPLFVQALEVDGGASKGVSFSQGLTLVLGT